MGVDDVGATGGASRGSREPEDEQRQCSEEPRLRAQVLHDPVAVGDSVVADLCRRDDVDCDAGGPQGRDLLGDEVRLRRRRESGGRRW